LTLSLLKNKMREYISGTIIGISQKVLFGQPWGLRPVGDQRWGHGGLWVKWLFFGVDIVHHSDLAVEIITCDGEDHSCEPNLTPFRIGGVLVKRGGVRWLFFIAWTCGGGRTWGAMLLRSPVTIVMDESSSRPWKRSERSRHSSIIVDECLQSL